MPFETVTPSRAKELLDSDTWTYLDVRSVEEFEAGHPQGAYNIPVFHRSPMGMEPNPDFVATVQKHFDPDHKLVVGCAMGGRSARACEMLAAAGFAYLKNMHGGFSGARDESGEVTEPGWEACGYPTASEAPAERGWDCLSSS